MIIALIRTPPKLISGSMNGITNPFWNIKGIHNIGWDCLSHIFDKHYFPSHGKKLLISTLETSIDMMLQFSKFLSLVPIKEKGTPQVHRSHSHLLKTNQIFNLLLYLLSNIFREINRGLICFGKLPHPATIGIKVLF